MAQADAVGVVGALPHAEEEGVSSSPLGLSAADAVGADSDGAEEELAEAVAAGDAVGGALEAVRRLLARGEVELEGQPEALRVGRGEPEPLSLARTVREGGAEGAVLAER